VQSQSAVLSVSHLSVSLGQNRLLDDLSFTVNAGSTLAIIGPNGAGKTILFKALIGAIPASGTISWAEGARIGYVPQKLDIERDLPLTGREFIAAMAAVSGDSTGEIDRVLGLVELSGRVAGQPIGSLSGGQFQRLLVAFALMGRPTVLLFDEPTAGIDEPSQGDIYTLVRRLQEEEGLTLLLISHEINLVYHFADAVLCLWRHHACIGPPLEIMTPERLQEVYGKPLRFHDHDHADPR
jgi:zinc transport system ATP-binding protein